MSMEHGLSRERPCRSVNGRNLIVKLKSELDLARVVGSVARGPDLSKVGAGEVARSADGDHSVASEIRSIEVRMVDDVKELRTELESVTLLKRKILKHGEIHSVESGPWHLSQPTQRSRTR